MKSKKNLLSFLLAMVMLFTTFTPAFAANEGRVESSSKSEKSDKNQEDEIPVEYEDIEGKAYATFSLDSLEDLGRKSILNIGPKAVGDPLDSSIYKYWRVGIQWAAVDLYFPKNTQIELQFEDKTKVRTDPERYITVAKSDVILQENHTTDAEFFYKLKQTVDDDVLNDYNEKTKDGSRKYRWKIRYPLAMTDSVILKETGRDGITLTINQVPMPLYSVNWNVLSNRAGRPAFRAKWYDDGNVGVLINELNKKVSSNNEESIADKKYYSMWAQETEFNYITDKDGNSHEVEVLGYGDKSKQDNVYSGLDGTKFQRIVIVDDEGNEYGKDDQTILETGGKKYKYTITGDHRTPYGITIAEGLKVTYKPNGGKFADETIADKEVDGWHSEKMPNMPTGLKYESEDSAYANLTFAGWSTRKLDPTSKEDMATWEAAKPLSDNLKTIEEEVTIVIDQDDDGEDITKMVKDIRQEWPDDVASVAYKVDANTPLKGEITLYAVYTKQLAGKFEPKYKETVAEFDTQKTVEAPKFYEQDKFDDNDFESEAGGYELAEDPTKPFMFDTEDENYDKLMAVFTNVSEINVLGSFAVTPKSLADLKAENGPLKELDLDIDKDGEVTINIPIIVTYKDKSTDKVVAPIKISTLAGNYKMEYPVTTTKAKGIGRVTIKITDPKTEETKVLNTNDLATQDKFVIENKDDFVGHDKAFKSLEVDENGNINFEVNNAEVLAKLYNSGDESLTKTPVVIVKFKDGSVKRVHAEFNIGKTLADKFKGKLTPKDIKVWVGDNINWIDGISEKNELPENIVVKDKPKDPLKPDELRNSSEKGKFQGTLIVTFSDGSDLEVSEQNLYVAEHITKDDSKTPDDAIVVTFKKGTGVETIGEKENTVEEFTWKVKPDTVLFDEGQNINKLPVATVSDSYLPGSAKWYSGQEAKGEDYVVTADNNVFTAKATKLSDKEIIPYLPADPKKPTDPDDKNIPENDSDNNLIDKENYVIVAVKANPADGGTFTVDKKEKNVVSVLVKIGKKWADVIEEVKTITKENSGYKLWFWEEVADDLVVANNDVKNVYFIGDVRINQGREKQTSITVRLPKGAEENDILTVTRNGANLATTPYTITADDIKKGYIVFNGLDELVVGDKFTAQVSREENLTNLARMVVRALEDEKPDVIVNPTDPTPKGYVRVTFDPTRDGILSTKAKYGEMQVYDVKATLTWGEAVEKGMEVPRAMHLYYEFIFDGWAPRLQEDSELIKGETYVAMFYGMPRYDERDHKAEKKYYLNREMNYVQGTGKGMFSPSKGMTRAEAATILANVLRNEGFIKTLRVLPYSDVDRNAWYYDAALIVTQANVFKGTDKGMFEGSRLITRAEWIATLARFQRVRAIYGNNLGVKDGHWAMNEVEGAFQQGWLALYRRGTDFDMAIPRQEAVYIANRAFGKVIDRDFINKNVDKMINFPDVNKANEFFYDIIAASNTYFTSKDRGEWLNSLTRKGDFILKMNNYEINQTSYRR